MQRIIPSARIIASRLPRVAQKSQQCRKMGGHGGAHDKHYKPEPYAPKHDEPYSEVAYPFGIKPGDALEGWEIPVYSVYLVCFLITFVGIGYCQEDTSFTVRNKSC